jgi:hypothetical protein
MGLFYCKRGKSQNSSQAGCIVVLFNPSCYLTGSFMLDALIAQLVAKRRKASTAELTLITEHVAAAPFATDLLQVDAPLWGGFWQFDVISPGYTLPADELALLRATRLDQTWPQDTILEQFVDDLHQAIGDPQAGVWTLPVAGEPCLVFAAYSGQQSVVSNQVAVVWYCATTGNLHAGYRTEIESLHFEDAVEQRSLKQEIDRGEEIVTSDWLVSALEQKEEREERSLAARIDAEILRLRVTK